MYKVRFINSKNTYSCSYLKISGSLATLQFVGTIPQNKTLQEGFEVLSPYDESIVQGTYWNYNTVYSREDNTIVLSNDGRKKNTTIPTKNVTINIYWDDDNNSGYKRPNAVSVTIFKNRKAIETIQINASTNWCYTYKNVDANDIYTVSTNNIPSEYDVSIIDTNIRAYYAPLKNIIDTKIQEMNNRQQSIIANGVDVTLEDNTVEHFSLTEHDQTSLLALSLQVNAGVEQIPWHSANTKESCRYYSNADMKAIIEKASNYILYHVTYFRDLRIYIKSLLDANAVDAIYYGIDIPDPYASAVLKDLKEKLTPPVSEED